MTIYDEKLKRAAQARKIAEALSQAKSPDGSMVSGHYVSPGWAKQLAYGIDKFQGARGMSEADAMESAANTEKNTAVDDWMKSMPQSQPERQSPIYNSGANQLIANALKGQSTTDMPQSQQAGSQTIPAQPVTPEQRMAWILKGNSIDKDSASLGAKYLEIEQAREAAKDTALRAESDKKEQRDIEKNKPHWMMVEDSSGQHIVNANNPSTPHTFGAKPKVDQTEKPVNWTTIQTDNGIVQANPRTGEVRPLNIKPPEKIGQAGQNSPTQHIKDATESNALLDDAEKYGPLATASGSGQLRDYIGAKVGVSTEGAQYAAKMKVLGASLTAKVPKMSGPQSDKDVAMYKEAAGNLANDALPWDTRKAAIQVLRDINKRQLSYGNQNNAPNIDKPKGIKFLGFE